MTAANDNHTTKRTREAHDAYVANRKEAGRVIDIETTEITMFYCNYFDPYETYPFDDDPPDDLPEQCRDDWSQCWFVRSKESGGWIVWGDLPPEKQQAMDNRIELLELWDAARAAHPLYEVVNDTGLAFLGEIKWKGDGEEPSWAALIEWFKVIHPAQASEIERKIDGRRS